MPQQAHRGPEESCRDTRGGTEDADEHGTWACVLGTLSALLPPPDPWGQRGCGLYLTDSATALTDMAVLRVEGLTFRGEHTGPLWTVQLHSPRAHPLSLCGEGARPHLPPLLAFAQKGKTRGR